MKGKFPNGLRSAMERRNVGPTELARSAETSKQNIQRWADGDRQLDPSWAERLAPLLGTTPEELIFPHRHQLTIQVPLISWVSAGRLTTVDCVTSVDIERYLTTVDLPTGDWIALEVRGDSMDRIAPDGAFIVVNRSEKHLIDGKYYVFGAENGEATFKRYRANPPRLQPYSFNPDHETIYPKDGMGVVGRVRRVINNSL